MIPQLWKRNLEWLEWRQMHPDLDDREAEYLYQVEQKMFQNYQDEIRNQMLNRQTRLVGDLMNLSADISTILNKGGGLGAQPRRYVLISGAYGTYGTGLALNRGSDLAFSIRKDDEFVFNFIGGEYTSENSGTYRALQTVSDLTGLATNLLNLSAILFTNELQLNNSARYEKISNSTDIKSNTTYLEN